MQHPRTTGAVTLVQPQTGDPDRWITKVTVTFDGTDPVTVALGPQSRTATGQVIRFSPRKFKTLRLTVSGVGNEDDSTPVSSRSSVGFAEVDIPGVSATETVAMPQDLLRAAGSASASDRLSLVMTRLRASGSPPRSDIETSLARSFWLPTSRTFSVVGAARISPLVPDDEIDRLVGRTTPGATPVAYSLGRLPGDTRANAMATIDSDPSTIWEPGFGVSHQAGQWLQYKLPRPVTFDRLDLQVVADGEHSIPSKLTISADSGSTTVTLPSVADSPVAGSVTRVPVTFPALTGQSIRITVDNVQIETTPNYYSQSPIAMPIGIAEVGIPGVQAPPLPAAIPSSCRGDLLTLDGSPLWVSVSGSTSAALARQPLTISLCGPDAGGLALGPGAHTLRSTTGQTSGFDIDQLALDSAPGGGTMPLAGPTTLDPPPVASSPVVHVDGQDATSVHLSIHGLTRASGRAPFDLILGESINNGWTATVVGGRSLGKPMLIDGFANGWRIDPSALGSAVQNGTASVVLRWQPQTGVNVALIVSLLAILACVVLAIEPGRRWRRARRPDRADAAAGHDPSPAPRLAVPADVVEGPRLASLFRGAPPPAPPWVAVVTGVVAGVVAGVVTIPAIGLAVGVACAVALFVPRLRALLGLVAVAGIAAAGIYTVAHQALAHVPAGGSWTLSFDAASKLTWAGVVFLAADTVVELVLQRRSERSPHGTQPEPEP